MLRRTFLIALTTLATACAVPEAMRETAFASDRIAVTAVGSGPDVVLIPGMGSSPTIWRGTVAALPGYRYHLVQVAGFAGVPVGGNGGTGPAVAPIAAEIARYITDAGLDAPALVGHSMGGTLAMSVAADHPERVGKLMVVDMLPFLGTFFGPPGTTAESIRPVAEATRAQIAATDPATRAKQVEASMAMMVEDRANLARPLQEALASDLGLNARVMHDLIATDLRPRLAAYKGPLRVLYVRGPNIPLSDAQIDAVFASQFAGTPQATLRRVPDARHLIMLDRPAEFHAEVREFLD